MPRRLGPRRSTTIAFDLNRLEHELRAILLEEGDEVIEELAKRVAEEAQKNAPVLPASATARGPNKRGGNNKSGPLKDNIFYERSPRVPASWIVCSPAWYSHFVEYGTEPHEMPDASKQKKGQTMVFPGTNSFAGKVIRTPWVFHPGLKQKAFLRPAADKVEQILQEILKARYGV